MHIDRQIGAASDLGRHFDDANAPARETADLRMGLDAANNVEIGRRRLHRSVDIDTLRTVELRIVMALQPTDQVSRQEGINARLRRLGDEVPEAGQRHA